MLTTAALIPEGKIAVAFSGGADSLALLWMLHEREGVHALYVNHHLRPEAELEREIALNASNCARLGVPLEVLDIDPAQLDALKVTMGLEGACRTLRYRLLFSWCREHDAFLAVAHHRDDQRENVAMRMLSGAATSHLAIAFERTADGIRMFRPLLPYSHEELCAMLRGEGLVWSEDSTNTDEKIARNQMRHSLLPALCARYAELPELLDAVARFSQMLRAFIEKRIAGFNPALPLERNEFLALVPLARDELLYRYLGRGGRVPFRWVCRIRLLLEQGPSSWEERFGSQRVWCDDGLMHVREIPKLQSFCYWGDCLRQGGVVSIPSLGCLHVRPWHEGDPEAWIRLDPQKLKRPVLRNAREGDRIELAGKMTGISHLVSGWKLQRPYATVPLLEDQGGIVAVFGSAVGGRDRIASPCKSLAPRNLFVYYWD